MANLPTQKRLISEEDYLSKRALLLVGPRGSGKSTFLLSLSQKLSKNVLYVSLDNPLVAGVSLFELGDWVFQNGYDVMICDEVHCSPDWATHLKALYDSHPTKTLWASDSSSLVLRAGLGDLSRRFLVREFSYLSFEEYLWLKHGLRISGSAHQIETCVRGAQLNLQREFKDYLQGGMRPFFLEGDYEERLRNTVDKIIHADIPYFLPEVRESHLNLMRHIMGYLATSPIPTLNIDSLSKTWAVSKLTVYHLLAVMEQTSLIQIIRYEGLKKGQSKGGKIFFGDPSLYAAYHGQLGNVREAYFCMQMRRLHRVPECPKDDSQYDYRVGERTFEIGGRSKKAKQADYVIRDDIDLPAGKVIPLWFSEFFFFDAG
jgi:predicted AAA+ superfamily ATPase